MLKLPRSTFILVMGFVTLKSSFALDAGFPMEVEMFKRQSFLTVADWTTSPSSTYNSQNLELQGIVAEVTIEVVQSGPMSVQLSGAAQRVSDTRVLEGANGTLIISSGGGAVSSGSLQIRVGVPHGSNVVVNSFVGELTIGDTGGALDLKASAVKATIGLLSRASLSLAGTSQIKVAGVAGLLDLQLVGSGNADFGHIGELNLNMSGGGNIFIGDIQGPVHMKMIGSGSIRFGGGYATQFSANIVGSGVVDFDGVAKDPHIEGGGSGRVRIRSYSGNLDTQGTIAVKIGAP